MTEHLPALYLLQGLTAQLIANGNGPNYNCAQRPIQHLTNVRQTIADAIAAMQPRGSTVIPEGLAWAWRVISPGLPYDQGAPYSDKTVTKVVILLTDGRNQVERGAPYNSFYSAYGFANKGHIGPVDGSQSRQVLNAKTAALCNNIKADKDGDPATDDIYVYTIALEIDTGNAAIDAETKGLLEACATPAARCPGQQCFYDTPSGNRARSGLLQDRDRPCRAADRAIGTSRRLLGMSGLGNRCSDAVVHSGGVRVLHLLRDRL